MNFLPEWAPNVHPLIVHFPIALFFIAALFDFAGLFARKRPGVRMASVALYALGAVGALAAFFTGRAAADAMLLPIDALTSLNDHADWAGRTVWFYGLYAFVRLAVLGFNHKGRSWTQQGWIHLLLFLVGAGGLFLVVQTGDRGAKMVFSHGVGVQAMPQGEVTTHDHEMDHDAEEDTLVRPYVAEDSSWQWKPGPGARRVLEEEFRFLEGSLDDLITDVEQVSVLALRLQGDSVLFVMGDDLRSIQAEVELNVEQFDGTVRLVHHVHDPQNYDFLALEDGSIRQGRVRGGEMEVFDNKQVGSSGWLAMRAFGDDRHFRGYLGDELQVHGHGSPPAPGPVGLRLEGTGTVLLRSIGVQSLR